MKLKITAIVLSVLALFALSLTACKKPQPDKLPPDDENFLYTKITEAGSVVGYEISGIANYDQCPSAVVLPAYYKGKRVKKIADKAFYDEFLITAVTVSDGIESIGELAFADCANLETVSLANSVKVIDGYAFSQCKMLKTINFPTSLESIGEGAFVACENLEGVEFHDGLKRIGDSAFAGCSKLPKFIMPDTVTSIGFGVLMFQTGGAGFGGTGGVANRLTELVMSDNILEIPDFAFSKCNISSFEIGKRVRTVKYSSFYGCGRLESVVIPKSVTKIESYAFYDCSSLNTVFYAGTEAEWDAITIGINGNAVSTATKYYYSETRPASGGNFWHYVNDKPTVW